MHEYVIQIDFQDRPGLGYEIFVLTEKNGIDKIAMEAFPGQGMMIKLRCAYGSQLQKLIDDLKSVEGVQAVKLRDQMPNEERTHELNTILNSVSEGIVAVDKEGNITHINNVACKIFHCTENQAIGLGAEELFSANPPILDTLRTGQPYSLKERRIKKNGKTIHIMASGVPVINERGQIIGAVTTIKDFKQVEEIISKVDRRRHLTTFEDIAYQSPKMAQLVGTAKTVAKGNSTILLRGESGTGKELFATAIHMEGVRHNAPFIAINCAALPDTLLESELFGYEEGAFTGAAKGGKKGLFEQASGGTLFLDEIGEISPQVQVRLLRVLQEGTIRKVGGTAEIPVDVRVIAATHRNLEDMIKQQEFREDLYYRLNVIPLTIPPLRERPEDIPLIAQRLIQKICGKLDKPMVRLQKDCIELLMVQKWPGNVRQLENTLERLINLIDTSEIIKEDLLEFTDVIDNQKQITKNQNSEDFLHLEIPKHSEWPLLKDIVNEVEKQVISQVLGQYPSSRSAGQVLGVSNTTILNKIKAYKINV